MSETPVFRRLLEAAAGESLPGWPSVAPVLTTLQLRAGEQLFGQGEVHPFVYAVSHGLLKLVYVNESGDEWVKSFAYEGRFFASLSALAGGGETAFMTVAIEDSRVERLPYDVLASIAARDLRWARAVLSMTMLFAARKEQRERDLLTLTAEERYVAFAAEHPHLAQRIAQKDLARHLGVTPVGLNRIVQRVRRRSASRRAV